MFVFVREGSDLRLWLQSCIYARGARPSRARSSHCSVPSYHRGSGYKAALCTRCRNAPSLAGFWCSRILFNELVSHAQFSCVLNGKYLFPVTLERSHVCERERARAPKCAAPKMGNQLMAGNIDILVDHHK